MSELDESTILKIKPNKVYNLAPQLSKKRNKETIDLVIRRQLINDFVLAALSVISIWVVYFEVFIIQSEEFYREELAEVNSITVYVKKRNTSNNTVSILRIVNIVLTIGICKKYSGVLIYKHYNYRLLLMKYRKIVSKYGIF